MQRPPREQTRRRAPWPPAWRALLGVAGAGLLGVPAAWAQHAHEKASMDAGPAATIQLGCLIVGTIVVLRTVRDILRARPWSAAVELAYEQAQKTRARYQAAGLLIGLVLGLGVHAIVDSRFHNAFAESAESSQSAAARARLERQMELDADDVQMLKALAKIRGDDASDPPEAPAPDADAHDAQDAGDHSGHAHQEPDAAPRWSDWFHRVLFGIVGAAAAALLALAIPIRPPAASDADPEESPPVDS